MNEENLGVFGKDALQLKGAGSIFFLLGTLNKLCFMCLCLDCDQSHEGMLGIFYLRHHVGAQNVSDLEAFQIIRLGTLNLYLIQEVIQRHLLSGF